MTNPDLTLIAVLLDRSGSMQSIKTDTEGGFDAFVEAQRALPGRAVVTLARFDNEYERVYTAKPIAEVPPLQLLPRGMTALLDGIGRFSTEVGAELAALPEAERPGKVIVVVMTDGHENASREWTKAAVRALVEQQESRYSWEYLFLGANIDAITVGGDLGFKADRSITYAAAPASVNAVFSSVSDYAARSRGSGKPVGGFSVADRQKAKGD
jgi:hypothetical protein